MNVQIMQRGSIYCNRLLSKMTLSTSAVPLQKLGSGTAENIPDVRPNLMGKIWRKLGGSKRTMPKSILTVSGLRLYMCCTDMIESKTFIENLKLPDTFNSWFSITGLHVWMVMVRLFPGEDNARFVRNVMVKSMWDDVQKRAKALGPSAIYSKRKEGILQLGDRFQASLFTYDEGLLSNDKVLAGALWNCFFEINETDFEVLSQLVGYVRKQIAHLETQPPSELLKPGIVTFLPYDGDILDVARTNKLRQKIIGMHR